MNESGFPDFEATVWFGLFAPSGTPQPVIEKLNRETVKIMASPDVRKKLGEFGNAALGNTPAEFANAIKAETPDWAKVIKDFGITRLD